MKEDLIEILNISWPIMVIALSIYLIVRVAYYINNRRKVNFADEINLFIFCAYVLVLFQLVTYKNNEYSGINIIPFNEILRYDFGTREFARQVLGNIILFIPFGYFISYYVKIKDLKPIVFMTFLVSIIIETVQYFIGRSFDIDDILLNIIGGCVGFLAYIGLSAIKRHLPNIFKGDIIYSIIIIILIILIILYVTGKFCL